MSAISPDRPEWFFSVPRVLSRSLTGGAKWSLVVLGVESGASSLVCWDRSSCRARMLRPIILYATNCTSNVCRQGMMDERPSLRKSNGIQSMVGHYSRRRRSARVGSGLLVFNAAGQRALRIYVSRWKVDRVRSSGKKSEFGLLDSETSRRENSVSL
ncbi:hypothetical protein BOTBODRAFT_425831 [Botryobasidium botryosum FD-172 SS1]|uniref:Uncharacterized protein n=1 Tax=Botryobasidium botryosum (strain FD-172 SS1) TaxID=930990 RepID=A0A067MKQ8_BOTB1|nr:hypothetical protein BOTBODRAFT_425831 [Botryobasidium botryosum FD-172 SS1]